MPRDSRSTTASAAFGARPRRSALYMPASNARAIAKARTLPCDVVILDLEDAVAPDMKDTARAQALAALAQGGFGEREIVVRANALSTPWGADDLAALSDAGADAVLMPKIDGAADVAACVATLGTSTPLWVMIETARSVLRLEEIASAPGVAGLVLGTNDLAKETGMRPGADRLPFLGFIANAVAAARAHGLVALDGVHNAIDDTDGLARECAQAVAFGCDGKTLIHPSQIDVCNRAFSPSADEVAWARAVRAAFDDPATRDKGAIRLDGKMVERLHLDQAMRILAMTPPD